jgi:phosphatidylinositol dimannoside acyltransferase
MSSRLGRGLGRAAAAAGEQAAATGYVAGWRLVGRLPESTARSAFRRLADELHRRDGRSVQRLRANLDRARPGLSATELDELTREAVRSYLRYWRESFRLPTWPKDDLVRRTRTVGEHHIRDAHAAGAGVVAALPHMANWDWAGAWACSTGMPLVTVAERLRPERLYDEFVAYRASLGMRILPLTGGGTPVPQLEGYLRDGGLVCLLADRDLSRNGLEVSLCGRPARMPRGPALLARRTGAPLLPVTLAYRGEDMEITFHPPVPPAPGDDGLVAMTQAVADRFSAALRADPQDWHMMQRVFVEDLGAPPGTAAR